MLDVQWTTVSDGDVVTIALSGELDLAGCPHVTDEVLRAEATNPGRLVIDLRRLGFIDSSGLRVLVGAHQRAVSGRRDLSVVVGTGTVARAIALTKLDEVLPLVTRATGGTPPA